MAIPFNDNLHVAAPKPVDKRYLNTSNLPYANIGEVLSTVPVYERYVGLTVLLTGGVEYWFQPDVSTLVEKTGGSSTGSTGTITGATQGLSLYNASKQIGLGGTLTGITQIDMPFGTSLTFSGLTGSLIQLNAGFNMIGNFDQAVIYVQQGDIYGYATGSITLQNNAGGFLFGSDLKVIDSRLAGSHAGLEYQFDYSGDFTDRSLVDKGWVLAAIASGATTGGTGAGTLNDVLIAGSDANGQTITELLGVTNTTNDFNISAPNIYFDGSSSVIFQSTTGGAYIGGATETIIGDGVGNIGLQLPFTVASGSLLSLDASGFFTTLPPGSGKQVIGLKSGLPAYKQLKYDDFNMPSGSLLGRTTATSGVTELISAQDGVDIASGNLRLGGSVGNNINFTATSQKLFQFDDHFDFSVQGNDSQVRFGFGGQYVSSVKMLSMGFSTGIGRGAIGNLSTMAINSGFTLTMAGGEASNLNGSPITFTSGPAYNSGNGKGGDIKFTAGIGNGSGVDGNVVLDLGPNGFLQFQNGSAAAAVSTATTHKVPIKVGSTTYYLCLTATA